MDKQINKTPLVRFPEFKDDWEHKQLNKLLSVSKTTNKDLKYGKEEVLSVSGESGIVNQIEHLGRSYAGVSVHNYGVVELNQIVYTKSPLKANPYGIIKLNKRKAGIVSTLYAVYNVNQETDGQFIEYYFSLDANLNRYLRPLVRKGAKNDMKISNEYVLNDRIYAPQLREQQKIAHFFSIVDQKLNQLQKKLNGLEQYKKGMMQQIFSQKLRFKDNNGKDFPDWKKDKLLNLAERVNVKNKENNQNVLTISAQNGLINQLDYFNDSVSSKNLLGYYLLNKNDFAYNRSYSKGYPMGAIKRLKRYEKGVVSTLYICFRFKRESNLNFFEQYFESGLLNKEIEKYAQEGARNHGLLNIGLNDFFSVTFMLPSNKEQEKISDFLSKIDDKVNVVKDQIENIKTYKKGLSQKMFV